MALPLLTPVVCIGNEYRTQNLLDAKQAYELQTQVDSARRELLLIFLFLFINEVYKFMCFSFVTFSLQYDHFPGILKTVMHA